jgi:hypothetical protein
VACEVIWRGGSALKNSVTIATLPFSVIAEVVAVDAAITTLANGV